MLKGHVHVHTFRVGLHAQEVCHPEDTFFTFSSRRSVLLFQLKFSFIIKVGVSIVSIV